MSEKQQETLVCPSCANVNPFAADVCLKCGLSLEPIRGALAKAGASAPSQPREPVPEMPELLTKERKDDLGQLVDGRLLLVRGMAPKRDAVVAFFFRQLANRAIPGVDLSWGHLVVEKQEQDSIFVERFLEEPVKVSFWRSGWRDYSTGTDWRRAKATVTVRVFPSGKDLMVEWRHYVLTSMGMLSRKDRLEGFMQTDSDGLELAVRASLEEAIDLAGISKELVQQTSEEHRRII